jgi:hypothetical protein
MGYTAAPLGTGPLGLIDRASRLVVDVGESQLASTTALQAFAGANLAAVRNGDGEWEVLQFLNAALLSPGVYELSDLLRGQAGSEHAMRAPLPAGAPFVLIDDSVLRLPLSGAERDLALNWRYGPATRDVGDGSYVSLVHAFRGVGLRPYAPAHVRGTRSGGDLALSWVRRTRVGGDGWNGPEVPLSEADERYEVDILDGVTVKRTIASTVPSALYTAAAQTVDFGAPQATVRVRVHQLSAVAGRGSGREAFV